MSRTPSASPMTEMMLYSSSIFLFHFRTEYNLFMSFFLFFLSNKHILIALSELNQLTLLLSTCVQCLFEKTAAAGL